MTIQSVSLQDFMNIKSAHLLFTKGFNVLWGDNGQGKSSVLEAIAMCLTNRKKGDSWKDYIRNGADAFDVRMVLQMTDDPNDLMIFHYRGSASKSSMDKEVKYQDATYTGDNANVFLARTFDQGMISQVLFSLQDSDTAIKMPPAKRREIFKTIFNSDFPETIARITEDQNKVTSEIVELRTKISVLSNKKYNFFRILVIDESQLEMLKKELADSEASELDKEKYKLYADKIIQATKKRELIADLETQFQATLARIESYKKQFADIAAAQAQLLTVTLKEQRDAIIEQDIIVKDLEKQKKEHEEQFAKLNIESQIKQDKETIAACTAAIQLNKKQIETRQRGLCDKCGSKFEAKDIADLELSIIPMEGLLEVTTKSLKEKEGKVKEAQAISYSLVNAIYESKAELAKRIGAKEKTTTLNSTYEDKMKTISNSIDLEKGRGDTLSSQKVKHESDLETLASWLQENMIPQIVPEGLIRPVAEIRAEIDSLTKQIITAQEQEKINKQLTAERIEDQEEIKRLNLDLNSKQLRLEKLKVVKKIYETDFPSHINLKACEILQRSMNQFFEHTKDKFQVTMDQDSKGINFYYKSAEEPNWNPGKMVSGFESSLLTLGFKSSVASAFGSELIVLDEPDHDASETNSQKLFEAISNIKTFNQIFVITHQPMAMELFREMGSTVYSVEAGEFRRV